MAESIVSSLLSSVQFSITAADGTVQAKSLKIAKVGFKYAANPHRSIREDGTTVVDSKTIMATELSVSVYCETVDALRQVNDLLKNRDKLFTISSKGIILENMAMASEEVDQSPKVMSAYPIELRFTEVIVSIPKPVLVKQSGDANTISQGLATVTTQVKTTVTDFITQVKANAADLSRQVIGVFSG